MKFSVPRGTHDILPEEQPYWRYVERTAEDLCIQYGYDRIDTPTFEETGLFTRAVGEGTDIVDKEMYSFLDKGNNDLTLQPEGTAPVVRAYLEHGMHTLPQPVRLYYLTSIFRYDRPQAGRYREHHQFGAEALGEMDPGVDAEVISLAWAFYRKVGLSGLSIQVNSIGCPACRPNYLNDLVEYYTGRKDELCADCVRRLTRNPLRLLDCKVPSCQPQVEAAPKSSEYLCEECHAHFEELKGHLDRLALPYTLNHRLVRGLDYYTKTVFEFWAEGIGAQNAVGGGGRYDLLAETLGGKATPGIGFGIGLERVILTAQEQSIAPPTREKPDAFIAHLGAEAKGEALILLDALRSAGLSASCTFGGRSLKAQMRRANESGARFALILGDEEIRKGTVTCRDMSDRSQEELPLVRAVDILKSKKCGTCQTSEIRGQ